MNHTLRNIGKQALRATVIATTTIAALFLLNLKLNTDWLEAEKMIAEQLQFSDLFFKWHSHTANRSFDGKTVHVIDINRYQKRNELAALFDSIADAQPYLVAIDITWGKYAMPDAVEDSLLVASLNRLPNLILAEEAHVANNKWELKEQASFTNNIEATKALINLPQHVARTWRSEYIVNSDTIPTFAASIAQKMGVQLPKQQNGMLIDYSIDTIPVLRSSRLLHSLRNQIVIVGDVEDTRDAIVVPATFCHNMQLPGVLVHRQIVQTILVGSWMREISKTINWLIIYVVIWLFLFCESFIPTQFTWNESIKQATVYLTKIFILLLLIFVAYILFWKGHLYINVWGAILAPAMIWVGKLIVDMITIIVHYCMEITASFIKKGMKK